MWLTKKNIRMWGRTMALTLLFLGYTWSYHNYHHDGLMASMPQFKSFLNSLHGSSEQRAIKAESSRKLVPLGRGNGLLGSASTPGWIGEKESVCNIHHQECPWGDSDLSKFKLHRENQAFPPFRSRSIISTPLSSVMAYFFSSDWQMGMSTFSFLSMEL